MSHESSSASPGTSSLTIEAQLERVRLESKTLYRIVRVIAGSAEVPQILAGVVELLTEGAGCHACFVYLREGEQLRLRGASRNFSQLIGQVQIPAGAGLVGWSMSNGQPAFAQDNALEDPRFYFVPELEEESFQSMASVAIPARQGPPIGAISVHTRAPHEFDDETVTFLAHTASLLAGAVETAQLYEEASHRVETLTSLGRISEKLAATDNREGIYETLATGLAELFPLGRTDILEFDQGTGELEFVATSGTDPPSAIAEGSETEDGEVLVVSIVAGDEVLGEMRTHAKKSRTQDGAELLGAIAHQAAVSLKRAELIERLTEEYITRDLLDALSDQNHDRAKAIARKLRLDLDRDHLVLQTAPAKPVLENDTQTELLETDLREIGPRVITDTSYGRLTALIAANPARLEAIELAVGELATRHKMTIGISNLHRGTKGIVEGLAEAKDAATVASRVESFPTAKFYRDLGSYRYLVRLPAAQVPRDHSWTELEILAEYDGRRQTQLIDTLERCLEHRGSVSGAAKELHVHPNTVRQRLERIEELTSIDLGKDDLLALEVALRLFRLADPS